MQTEVQRWAAKCLKEDRARYGRDTGFSYRGDTLGITHIAIASYSTLNNHARKRALYEYLQQTIEAAYPESTVEECYSFPSSSWETLELTVDTTNADATELAMHLLQTFEGDEMLFRELEEKYEKEELLRTIQAYKPLHNTLSKLPDSWAERVDDWLGQCELQPSDETVADAFAALGYMSSCACPNKHYVFVSDRKRHWSELFEVDNSAQAAERYERWVQQRRGAFLTRVLPGFVGTDLPYPITWNDDYSQPIFDMYKGKCICPKCGLFMKETE